MKGDGNPMQVKICPNCSTENRPESEKCAKCDWTLADVQSSESRAAQAVTTGPPIPTSAPARQGSSAGVIILILVIIAGAAFAGWWFLLRGGGGPEATVNRHIEAIMAADFEAMKSTLTKSGASQFATASGHEKQLMEFMKQVMGAATPKVTKTSYEGENAIVEIEVAGGQGSSGKELHGFVLVKEDGQWKIDPTATGLREQQKTLEKLQNMRIPGGPGGP